MDNVKCTCTEQGNKNKSLLHGKRMTVRDSESNKRKKRACHCIAAIVTWCCIPDRAKCAVMKFCENTVKQVVHIKISKWYKGYMV